MQMIPPVQQSSLISVTGLTSSKYGYHPYPKKCTLIVDAEHEAEAKSVFQQLGIKVVNGYRFLGGFIGDQETTKQFLHRVGEQPS